VRLLLDEMFPPSVARALREAGHDVVAVQERPELVGLDDPGVFAQAQVEGRAVVTENVRDLVVLATDRAAESVAHFGVILTASRTLSRHQKRFVGATVDALVSTLERHPSDDPMGLVIWL
jgi:predicted nuclease of predicted toxin-antitoxin system